MEFATLAAYKPAKTGELAKSTASSCLNMNKLIGREVEHMQIFHSVRDPNSAHERPSVGTQELYFSAIVQNRTELKDKLMLYIYPLRQKHKDKSTKEPVHTTIPIQ